MPADRKFERSLEQLREELHGYGHARFPQLRNEVDELVNHTLLQLWEYRKGAQSQKRLSPLSDGDENASLRRIAFTIFKRRAVDAYRKFAREWAIRSNASSADEEASSSAGAEQRTLLKQMLRVCIAELANMTAADRGLLAELSESNPRPQPVSARDRQRLRRIRERLKAAISRELGETASKLLREAF